MTNSLGLAAARRMTGAAIAYVSERPFKTLAVALLATKSVAPAYAGSSGPALVTA